MHHFKHEPSRNLDVKLIFQFILFALFLAGVALFYVNLKNQQHILGEETRILEKKLKDLKAYNQVLRSDISTLTSHLRITQEMGQGKIALTAISDQFVARITPPTIGIPNSEYRTAAASTSGGYRP